VAPPGNQAVTEKTNLSLKNPERPAYSKQSPHDSCERDFTRPHSEAFPTDQENSLDLGHLERSSDVQSPG
jgi:hypothetical protein